ncbi:3-oxoacyl-ACP synthase [Muricauda sp. CAU 1633]|uniref:3-oxoacyl-ACP synthase n=1 Tax=Allomuricauda sp. CAU 1633 TaxID=2816036 RepID=UPI001A8CE8E7|nr:3-oxoacyl-ACP synthase [Muricauda sp. CAU 1633]MBO0321080.1 3-oxoacyl-ACP synthase [Muricauda sp. CAU 1633]
MEKKKQLLEFCWDYVNQRTERLQNTGASLQESLDSETKSTAGDKHETGRAMVQLEQEKLAQQVQELDRVKGILKKIDITKKSTKIGLGSMVSTSLANYFISVSCGAFTLEGKPIYCISMESPIAKLLAGKETGENFVFNGATHSVLEVV